MTVSTTISSILYNGNGATTAFATTFQFLDETDLVVTKILISSGAETTQTLTTDYTVSGGSGSTGTVTMLAAPSSLYQLRIKRATERLQETDFIENNAFPVVAVENEFDRLTLISQEVGQRADDAYVLADAAPTTAEVQALVDAGVAVSQAAATAAAVSAASSASSASTASTAASASASSAASAAASLAAILGGSFADAPVSAAMTPVVAGSTLAVARAAMGVPGLGDNQTWTGNNTYNTGTVTFSAGFTAAGTAAMAAGTFSGNVAVTGTLSAGATTLNSTLAVTGAATMAAVTGSGAGTFLTLIPTGSSAPTNGMYLPAANTLGLASNSTLRLQFSSAGAWGIGGATYGTAGYVLTSAGSGAPPVWAAQAGGKVAQVVRATWSTFTTFTNTIPFDNTIPQITEGAERFTASITPTNASSTLLIEVSVPFAWNCNGGSSAETIEVIAALFRDSTANALSVGYDGATIMAGDTESHRQGCIVFSYSGSAASTSATTFRVRTGRATDTSGGLTTTHNGTPSSARFGGTLFASITITEILP